MGEHQEMDDLDERLTLVIELDDYADERRKTEMDEDRMPLRVLRVKCG